LIKVQVAAGFGWNPAITLLGGLIRRIPKPSDRDSIGFGRTEIIVVKLPARDAGIVSNLFPRVLPGSFLSRHARLFHFHHESIRIRWLTNVTVALIDPHV
jgi:hypothetical protein